MTELEKHEKAIRVLESINDATNRILRYETEINNWGENDFLGMSKFYSNKKTNVIAVKQRLQNYYNNSFSITKN